MENASLVASPDTPKETVTGAHSAMSSTYYTIAGTAMAKLQEIKASKNKFFALVKFFFWLMTWLPLGAFCYFRMLSHSNKVFRLIGYDGMTADMCDIRFCILKACRRFEEAIECADIGLRKPDIQIHTYVMLRLGQLEIICTGPGPDATRDAVLSIYEENFQRMSPTEPQQAIRIARTCARILRQIGFESKASEVEKDAQQLAEKIGASDQALKIGK